MKLVEFGRFAQNHSPKRGRKRPETIYFLGFTLYCTRNRQGNFRVGLRTEKTRVRRSLGHLSELMRRTRHLPVREQAINLSRVLRGHYAYYGIVGNFRALRTVHRFAEHSWRKILSSRSRTAYLIWEAFERITQAHPLPRPKLRLSYTDLQRCGGAVNQPLKSAVREIRTRHSVGAGLRAGAKATEPPPDPGAGAASPRLCPLMEYVHKPILRRN